MSHCFAVVLPIFSWLFIALVQVQGLECKVCLVQTRGLEFNTYIKMIIKKRFFLWNIMSNGINELKKMIKNSFEPFLFYFFYGKLPNVNESM